MPNSQALQEFALREADRMQILASQYRQMGFIHLARFLRANAASALKWASQGTRNSKEARNA